MTGPEHFQRAESLMRRAESRGYEEFAQGLIAAAQVHATLALAAATALNGTNMLRREYKAWEAAVSHKAQDDD